MTVKQSLQLLALSAMWGSSFIFMRILSPAIGPLYTAFGRLFIASLFFIVYYRLRRIHFDLKRHGLTIFFIAVINSAIPFVMFAIAALYIPAALSSIINSMSPMFGMVFALLFLGDNMTWRGVLGLLFGVVGVAVITGGSALNLAGSAYLGIIACLIAATCYGLASVLIKKYAVDIPAIIMAGYSQLFAALAIVPVLPFQQQTFTITLGVVLSLLALALICSALAYLIYYQLVEQIGPTKTLTVTFLMPAFSIVWAALFLGEAITLSMILGMAIVLTGTYLVVNQQVIKH